MLENLIVVFLVLKLSDLVAWSWAFTLTPFWIWLVLVLFLALVEANRK